MSAKHFVSSHITAIFLTMFCIAMGCAMPVASLGQSSHFQIHPSAGPTGVIVKSKFGGQIFGFDIDQNGTEGVLSESKICRMANFSPRSRPSIRPRAKSSEWSRRPKARTTSSHSVWSALQSDWSSTNMKSAS